MEDVTLHYQNALAEWVIMKILMIIKTLMIMMTLMIIIITLMTYDISTELFFQNQDLCELPYKSLQHYMFDVMK